MNSVMNILGVDLEDWHQLCSRRVTGGGLPSPSRNIFRQLDVLLDLLDEHDTKATFFVMGALAEKFPEIVRRVVSLGHEVASHGYDHLLVFRLLPEEFRRDTERSKSLLEDLAGKQVYGYRAPEFSIRRKALWALDILAELGFTYDSSIIPVHHRRYGIPGFSPDISRYTLPRGREIIEFPLSTFPIGRIRLPVAGGGYIRFMPAGLVRRVVEKMNSRRLPMVTYFHPYEFDPKRLDAFETITPADVAQRLLGWRANFHQNLRRQTVSQKVSALIGSFPFTSFEKYLKSRGIHECSSLF